MQNKMYLLFTLVLFIFLSDLSLVIANPAPQPDTSQIHQQFSAKDSEIARLRRIVRTHDVLLLQMLKDPSVMSVVRANPQRYLGPMLDVIHEGNTPRRNLPQPTATMAIGLLTSAPTSQSGGISFDDAATNIIDEGSPSASSEDLWVSSGGRHANPTPGENAAGPNDSGGHDYSRPVGDPSDPTLSTGWAGSHGSRTQRVSDYYRHTKSGAIIHVHGYYRSPSSRIYHSSGSHSRR